MNAVDIDREAVVGSKDSKDWTPTWSPAPEGLVTLDFGVTTRAIAWPGSSGSTQEWPADERDAMLAWLTAAERSEVLAAGMSAGPASESALTSEIDIVERSSGQSFLVADRDLSCPLGSRSSSPTIAPRRWVSLFAATRGFGGSCCVIDCGAELTVDLVDGKERICRGVVVPSPPSDAGELCRTVDREVIGLAEREGVDGPLLVITGPDARIYIESGRLPVQRVPDLVHRGLIELLAASRC